MKDWVANYIKGCATCQQNKILTHRTKVPLYRIGTTPNAHPFECIAMDLITGLPQCKNINAILTIVDQGCSRAAVFLPCSTTVTGPQIACLYLDNVYRWFSLPVKMITDRDPRFTSHFGKALASKLGVQQNLSTAFHPQTDGLSEQKNQWVEQYLWLVTSQHPQDWTEWLSIASAVHNNRRNATTGLSPNQILLSYDPLLHPARIPATANQTAEDRVTEMIARRKEAVDALNQVAHNPMAIRDQYRAGEQVWLEATHLRLPYQTSKLNPKRYGPFLITEALSPVVFRLELPATWKIHDVFHASLLSPYHETPSHGPNFSRPPPDLVNGEEEQEVERILDHRLFGQQRILQYLVKWKVFPESDNEWVAQEDMHALDLVCAFHRSRRIKAIVCYLQTSIPPISSCHLVTSPNLLSCPLQPQNTSVPPPIVTPLADPWSPYLPPQSQLPSNASIRLHSSCPSPEWRQLKLTIHHQLSKAVLLPQLPSNTCTRQPSSCLTPMLPRPPIYHHRTRAIHPPSRNTFAPRDKKSSRRLSKSSIAQQSPSPRARLKPYWRLTPAQLSNKRSTKLSPVDWSRLSSNKRRNGKPSRLSCAETFEQRKYDSSGTRRKERFLTVSSETTATTPHSSSPMQKGFFAPPIGSSSLTMDKSPCWTKTATTLTPTSPTSTLLPNITPTIPSSLCPFGSDTFSQGQPLCSTNSATLPPISMTGEYWPTSYASTNTMTTSCAPRHESSNTKPVANLLLYRSR